MFQTNLCEGCNVTVPLVMLLPLAAGGSDDGLAQSGRIPVNVLSQIPVLDLDRCKHPEHNFFSREGSHPKRRRKVQHQFARKNLRQKVLYSHSWHCSVCCLQHAVRCWVYFSQFSSARQFLSESDQFVFCKVNLQVKQLPSKVVCLIQNITDIFEAQAGNTFNDASLTACLFCPFRCHCRGSCSSTSPWGWGRCHARVCAFRCRTQNAVWASCVVLRTSRLPHRPRQYALIAVWHPDPATMHHLNDAPQSSFLRHQKRHRMGGISLPQSHQEPPSGGGMKVFWASVKWKNRTVDPSSSHLRTDELNTGDILNIQSFPDSLLVRTWSERQHPSQPHTFPHPHLIQVSEILPMPANLQGATN